MTVKLLAKQYLEFLNLKGCCTDSPESTLVKMPLCWKSHVTAHMEVTSCYSKEPLFQTALFSKALGNPDQTVVCYDPFIIYMYEQGYIIS